MPLKPRKEAFNKPPTMVASKLSGILRLLLQSIYFMRRDHINSLFTKVVIQIVAVISLVANKFLRLGNAKG